MPTPVNDPPTDSAAQYPQPGELEEDEDLELTSGIGSAPTLFKTLTVDPGQKPQRIDQFLANRLENASRSFIQRALSKGLILVDQHAVKASYRVMPGKTIAVYQDYAPQHEVLAEPIRLDIVYEDEVLLVVNKPAGMVVHPGHGHYSGTLINALLYYFKDLPLFQHGGLRPGLAHRIDKDTSGLLAVGKTEEAMKSLGQTFLHRQAHRHYLALAWGDFSQATGRIESNIGRDPADRQRMKVFHTPDQGKPAVTHWKALEHFTMVTLLECTLDTGRMHQIRVHLAEAGHPLFADARYGGSQVLRGLRTSEYNQFIHSCFSLCPRQALHAFSLDLPHPTTGEMLHLEAPLPEDFAQLLQAWRSFNNAFQQ